MPTVPINIGIHEFGNGPRMIVCERVHIRHQDDVEWICTQNLPFAVDLGRDTPFDHDEKYHAKKDTSGVSKVKSKQNKIDQKQVVKYSLAIYDDVNQEVLIEDPEIIIDP
jgi:hypothetical protein